MGTTETIDLAVIGAGAAGTWIADALKRAQPDRSVSLFERSSRVGGRLHSRSIDGLPFPIELGGMRYPATHPLVASVVEELGLETRPFNPPGSRERSYLRGVPGDGPRDPSAGRGYQLPDAERDRSASDLTLASYGAIVPGFASLTGEAWRTTRTEARYRDRPLIEWPIVDAMAPTLSAEGHRFVADAFGYDSGMRVFNAGDAIQYMAGAGPPTSEGRVPVDGMDSIPLGLAARFATQGGAIHLDHDLQGCSVVDGSVHLRFAHRSVVARRVVFTMAIPGLRLLAATASLLQTPAWRRVLASVESIPATKLYLWYHRPWWRDGSNGVPVIRTTTDLANRKTFYFDDGTDGPAAILAEYTDGRHTEPWVDVAQGASDGDPAPPAMSERIGELLRAIHPGVTVPDPDGSAFMHWGNDPHDTGWTFWGAGDRSDEIIDLAIQPEPGTPIFVAGETFSRNQAWVEGALETAQVVVDRILRD
jgi:monoamine oxidase